MNAVNTSNPPLSLVVIGAAGRLGSALVGSYSKHHRVIGLTRSELNLVDPDSIRRALEPLDFDRLILPGALTAVDYCEDHEDEAFAVNADGPKLIAEICADKGAHVTYISTDFVFDGISERAYCETAIARPLSVYGASKLEGEEGVLAVSEHNLVARVSWLYGASKPAFPEWIVGQALKQEQLALPEEKLGSPTSAEDVVDLLGKLLGLEGGMPASGVFHLSNSGHCSWQEWGQFCLDQASAAGLPLKTTKMGANNLEDIVAFVASRPINSVLSTEKFTRHTGVTPRPWQEALREHFGRTLAAPCR
jgi:dTDP-4-dehydrorhamnose reductase